MRVDIYYRFIGKVGDKDGDALKAPNIRRNTKLLMEAGVLPEHEAQVVSKKMVRNKHNTPVIIKYPFWKMTKGNSLATYVCINIDEAYIPRDITKQSVGIQNDIGITLQDIA